MVEDKKPNIFECMDWLDKHKEGDSQYSYYDETLKNRKKMLKLFGNPFFEEIKGKTEGIQKILSNSGYKNVDGLLKSLIIDGIHFFLGLDYKIRVDDEIRFDDYFLGLFDSLKINTNNKKLLNDILLELQSGGEDLPESPINILVNYQYDQLENGQESEQQSNNEHQEKVDVSKQNKLQGIIKDFWNKDYGFIKDLRTVGVEENKLEYTFLAGLHRDITKLLKGESISDGVIDKIFNYYNIDIYDRQLLSMLKNELEGRFPDLNGKLIMSGHGAFDDGSGSEKYCPLVMYEIGDEYVPISNSCVGEIGKIDPNKNPDHSFDMLSSYSNRDRFTVVKPTYSEYIKYDRERIKCWFVNVRSKKTGKIYRALSE